MTENNMRLERIAALYVISSCIDGWQQGDKGVQLTPRLVQRLHKYGLIEQQPRRTESRGKRTKRWIITEQGEKVRDSRPLRFTLPATVPEAHTR